METFNIRLKTALNIFEIVRAIENRFFFFLQLTISVFEWINEYMHSIIPEFSAELLKEKKPKHRHILMQGQWP